MNQSTSAKKLFPMLAAAAFLAFGAINFVQSISEIIIFGRYGMSFSLVWDLLLGLAMTAVLLGTGVMFFFRTDNIILTILLAVLCLFPVWNCLAGFVDMIRYIFDGFFQFRMIFTELFIPCCSFLAGLCLVALAFAAWRQVLPVLRNFWFVPVAVCGFTMLLRIIFESPYGIWLRILAVFSGLAELAAFALAGYVLGHAIKKKPVDVLAEEVDVQTPIEA